MKKNVLVLGATGMLGSMVYEYLRIQPDLNVKATMRSGAGFYQFDSALPVAEQFKQHGMLETKWDYIINCIGIIKPYCKDNDPQGVYNAIVTNAKFPHELARFAKEHKIKVIQIATDCVYSGKAGKYDESAPHDPLDVYGKTKSLGEVFDGSLLNIRCSIIGPERKGKKSLLEWFLNSAPGSELKGFTHHHWNGVTTLRFAELCHAIIAKDAYDKLLAESHLHHYVPADIVNKHELLTIFQDVFDKDFKIVAAAIGDPVDRTVSTKYHSLGAILPPITIAEDVRRMKEFMDKVHYYG